MSEEMSEEMSEDVKDALEHLAESPVVFGSRALAAELAALGYAKSDDGGVWWHITDAGREALEQASE